MAPPATRGGGASFARLDERARSGQNLTAVFFGCSLTWGANSTDPITRSWRAIVSRRLADRYPGARWSFVDASIGGTDSRLGAFRFARDVARHRPDLVFVDFTLNDDAEAADEDHLASYEAIVRRCIGDLGACVVQVLLCSKDMAACADLDRFATRREHLAIARAYGTGVADAFALLHARVASGHVELDRAWDDPSDTCHPGDLGYELFAEAVWNGWLEAVEAGRTCVIPTRMRYRDTYLRPARARLADLGSMPDGWTTRPPTRISAWYDSLMSRWLDVEATATVTACGPLPAAWSLDFSGTTLVLFGESTRASGALRVFIDGVPAPSVPGGVVDCRSPVAGTIRLVETLAIGLDPSVGHRLRMEPMRMRADEAVEWRLESLCIAGAESPGLTGRSLLAGA